MGARNRWNSVVVPARQATQPGGIGSLESILGLLKVKKFGLWQAGSTTLFLISKIPALATQAGGIGSWAP